MHLRAERHVDAPVRFAGALPRLGHPFITATPIIALPLAGLLWMSGAVNLLPAVAAMVLFVLVVLFASLLLLGAADATDMPAPAAWVAGVFATMMAMYVLVMLFHLLAVVAFAIWAGVVLALAIVFRERVAAARPVAARELFALGLCAGATVWWCFDLAQVPQIVARDGVLATWTDQFIHGAAISQFGDARAAGRQAIELAGLPLPLYHYGSYMLPAAFAWPLDLPGLPLATSLWVPLGFFTLCAGIYALGATLAGPAGGVAALAALTLVPDAATYGLHNRAFGYYWYMLEVPGACYAVAVALLSIVFLHRWARTRDSRSLLASAALVAASCLVRVHIFLLALPAWLASVVMLVPWSLRRRLALFAASGAAFSIFVFTYYRLFPDAVPALARFLYVIHQDHFPTAYDDWYVAFLSNHGPSASIALGVLLIFPACLGVFVVLYPLSVLLAWRSRGLEAIDLVPPALLAAYTVLMVTAPIPANADATELTQRPFVLLYAVIAIWTAAGFASWFAAQGGFAERRVWLPALALGAILVASFVRYTDADWRWVDDHQIAPGLPQAAGFLRSHATRGDIFAVQGLAIGRVESDAAVELVSLTGIPAYLARPYTHIARGARIKQVALERHGALAGIAQERSTATALARLRELGVQWYVVVDRAGPRWDAQRQQAVFAQGDVAVYSSRSAPARR